MNSANTKLFQFWCLRFPINHGKIIALALTVAVTACNSPATSNTVDADIASAAKVPAACPSQNFDGFLAAFMGDEKVQHVFTKYPYAIASYDPQNLEADPKTVYLALSEVSFPVILSKEELERNGVSMEVTRKEKNWFEVSTKSNGSGAYSKVFNFRWLPKCWFLTDSVDASA